MRELPVGPCWLCSGSSPLSLHASEGLQQQAAGSRQEGLATPPCAPLTPIASISMEQNTSRLTSCVCVCVLRDGTGVVVQLFTFNSFSALADWSSRGRLLPLCLSSAAALLESAWLDAGTFFCCFLSSEAALVTPYVLLVSLCVTVNDDVLCASQPQTQG